MPRPGCCDLPAATRDAGSLSWDTDVRSIAGTPDAVTMQAMDARDLRRWASDHRAAAARERQAAWGERMSAAEAFAAALALLRFDEEQNGSPFGRSDPVSAREDARVREAWDTLRRRWRRDR